MVYLSSFFVDSLSGREINHSLVAASRVWGDVIILCVFIRVELNNQGQRSSHFHVAHIFSKCIFGGSYSLMPKLIALHVSHGLIRKYYSLYLIIYYEKYIEVAVVSIQLRVHFYVYTFFNFGL